ncbi:MAG: outer membrane protein [Hyphomicrobiales bacterium]
MSRYLRNSTVIAGFTALLLSSPISIALGADLEPDLRNTYETNWEGAYIGLHAGYGALKSKSTVTSGPSQSWSQKAGGFLGGVMLGYNFDLNGYVLGIEADTGFGSIKDTENRPGIGDVKITHHGQHTLRLRGGANVGPGLLYVTGGLGLADIWARSSAGRDKEFFTGFVVGGGYEARISENLSARLEYLYGDYGKKTFNLGATSIRDKVQTHNIRLGVNWHFGNLF